MYYFAYASNLNKKQMQERAPESKPMFVVTLPNYKLVFSGWSRRWRGGYATIMLSRGDKVLGAVYEVSDRDLRRLDGYKFQWSDEVVEKHVEASELKRNSDGTKDYTDYDWKRFMRDNNDYYQAWLKTGTEDDPHQEIDFSTVPPAEYDRILEKESVQRVLEAEVQKPGRPDRVGSRISAGNVLRVEDERRRPDARSGDDRDAARRACQEAATEDRLPLGGNRRHPTGGVAGAALHLEVPVHFGFHQAPRISNDKHR